MARFAGWSLALAAVLAGAAVAGAPPVRVGVFDFAPLSNTAGTEQALFVALLDHIARDEGWELEHVPGKLCRVPGESGRRRPRPDGGRSHHLPLADQGRVLAGEHHLQLGTDLCRQPPRHPLAPRPVRPQPGGGARRPGVARIEGFPRPVWRQLQVCRVRHIRGGHRGDPTGLGRRRGGGLAVRAPAGRQISGGGHRDHARPAAVPLRHS